MAGHLLAPVLILMTIENGLRHSAVDIVEPKQAIEYAMKIARLLVAGGSLK